jgi:hypothetical protein
MLVPPILLTLGTSSSKLTNAQKMAFAKGVLAHLAIQSAYRVQHPGNLIICERMVSVGLTRLLSIGRFHRLAKLGSSIRDWAARSRLLRRAKPEQIDLVAMIVHLLDLATNESLGKQRCLKRYDIIDFGPLAAGSFDLIPAQAYEIKPLDDVPRGRAYVQRQVQAFGQTVAALGATLATAMGVPGLDRLRAVPGVLWPPVPMLLPLGSNLLLFYLAEPGVIAYEWLQFKRQSLSEVWVAVRAVEQQVREQTKPRTAVPTPEQIAQGAATIAMAVAIVAVAVVGVEAAAIGAGGAVVARALAPLAARLLPGGIGALSPFARGIVLAGGPALGASAPAGATQPRSVAGASAAYDALLGSRSFRGVVPEPDASGGVQEQASGSDRLADLVAGQIMHRLLVRAGQGNELYDEHGVNGIRAALRVWLGAYIESFGEKEFLAQFGEDALTEEAAQSIATVLVDMGQHFSLGTEVCAVIMDLLALTAEEVAEHLPEDEEDGESRTADIP